MKLSNSRPFAIDRVYIENKRKTTEYLTLHQITAPRKLSVLSLRVHVLSTLDHFYFCRDLHVKTLCNNNTSGYTYIIYITLQTVPCGLQTLMRKIRHYFFTNNRVFFYNLLLCPTRLNSHQLQNMQYNFYFFFRTVSYSTFLIFNQTKAHI